MSATQHLGDLHAFATVARLRSFRRAATELRVTPSALSHALKGLEERLGVRLLHRTTRSVSPTEAGQRLLERLGPALAEVQGALDEVNAFRATPMGTLRINAPTAACELVLAPLVMRFLQANPAMRVDLVGDDAFIDIVNEGFDAGVRFGESLQQDMVAIPLGPPQRFVVVGSPDYLARHGTPLTPRDLTQSHQAIRIRFPSGHFYKWEFARGDERLEIEVDGPLALNDLRLMVSAAQAGLGLAYVYEAYAQAALDAGHLRTVLQDWCPEQPGFYLYYPSRKGMAAGLRQFIEMIRAEEAAMHQVNPAE